MKNTHITLLILFLVQTSFGQIISFETTVITDYSNYGSSSSGSYAADLDGDNDLDLITYYYEGNFVWYENKPSEGGLVEPKIIHTSVNGSNANVFAIDIDNDGDMDVFASSGYDIFWYENLDGLGNFGNQNIISTEVQSVISIDYYDIDGDGDFDILSTSLYDDKVAWYENLDGLGNFGPQIIISQVSTISAGPVFVEDMDGDGDGDIVVSNNGLVWLENSDGNGTFTTEHIILAGNTNNFIPVDLDNDGDMDIVIADGYDDYVRWYENINGLGAFGSSQFIGLVNGDVNFVYAGDVDGDGDIDVLADGTGLFYFENDGNEDFGFYNNIYSTTTNAGNIYGADMDNDGDIDIISDGGINAKPGLAYNEFDQNINDFKREQILCEYSSKPTESYAADIDNDGDLDILVSSIGDNEISWFEDIDGTQNFSKQHIISTTVYNAKSLKAKDIDGDGDMDVFVASETGDKILMFRNQGDGTFENEFVITTSTNGPNMIQIVDMDDDGDLDIISSSYHDDKIAWYENEDGLGSFGVQQVISTGINGVITVYTGDFDSDGDLDLVASGGIDSIVAWFEHTDGQGNFEPMVAIAYGMYQVYSMDIGDIDGDGDLDILSGSSSGGSDLSWFENLDGNGQFNYANEITSTASAVVSLNDVDNDSDLDVVMTIGDDIIWKKNQDGLGNFSNGGHIMDIRYDKSFHAVDIDFDGDIDIVSTKEENDQLAYSKNLGVLGSEINGTVQVDVNGDGCDDLDAYYPNIMVVATNGSDSFGTFTLNNGTYQIPVNSGNFTTSIGNSLPSYYTSNPTSYTFNYSGLGNVDTANFCLEPNQPIPDVNISVFPLAQAKPGFDVTYRIVYKNVGTEQLSGDINFQFENAKLNYLNASETLVSQTTNSLTFNYSNLNSYESRTIDVDFNVFPPPTVNIDDVLSFGAIISPIFGDFTEDDNTFQLNQTVIGSYDPNDITCLEGDEILLDDTAKYLHYIIRFQNTGTAEAVNVKVDNILDDKLDWGTLQIETTSHSNRVVIKNGNELSFIFSGINLPDNTSDEPNSHGFIAYKIKPKTDVVIGDIFSSIADIFFDFNSAIITNTATTEIVASLSVETFETSTISMFPNPANNILNIKNTTKINTVTIYDTNGRLLKVIPFPHSKTEFQIDINNLSSGIYFLEVKSGVSKETVKFIKA